MYELSQMPGVRIIPPMMTFTIYQKDIDEMMYHISAKLLEPFGIEAKEYRRWTGLHTKEVVIFNNQVTRIKTW